MENVEIKQMENSELEIVASISSSKFDSYRTIAILDLGKSVEVSGFRKGHAPENIIASHIGEVTLLHAMAERAITDAYPKIIVENKIEAIGKPEISITKMAKGNPLEFKIKTAIVPVFELPDYKEISKKIFLNEDEVTVNEKDMENAILDIRTNWAHQMEVMKKKVESSDKPASFENGKIPPRGVEGDKRVAEETPPESKNNKDDNSVLPEFNDAFVKQLGAFENIEEFKIKLKENMEREKKTKQREKKRLLIMDEILKKISLHLPKILIDGELDRMMTQFKDNVAAMGQKPEDYFVQIKKNEDEVRSGWKNDAIKRVQSQFILNKIADAEKIKIPKGELESEVKIVMEKYPGVPKDRTQVYVENMMMNEKAFEILETGTLETRG